MGNLLLYVAAIIGGIGWMVYNGTQSQLNPVIIAQGVAAIVAGAGFILYDNMSYVKTLFAFKPTVTSEKIFIQSDYEKKDAEALYHLQRRCQEAGSKEGLDLCSKLNEVMFNLKIKEQSNAKVST